MDWVDWMDWMDWSWMDWMGLTGAGPRGAADNLVEYVVVYKGSTESRVEKENVESQRGIYL